MRIQASQPGKSIGLRSSCLAYPEVLAQSIALISPTMTAVLIIPLAFSFTGEGTWLSYLFATVMLLFVVFNLNQFARRSTTPARCMLMQVAGWALRQALFRVGL